MKITPLIVFFIIVFIANYLLNMILKLGQDIGYIFILSIFTTLIFYGLSFIRDRRSK